MRRWIPVLSLAGAAVIGSPLGAQVSATGNLTVFGELYDRSGSGTAARPDQTGRITANLTLSLFNGEIGRAHV